MQPERIGRWPGAAGNRGEGTRGCGTMFRRAVCLQRSLHSQRRPAFRWRAGRLYGAVPWHGSQFDIRTGRVVAGPAQEKIEVYSIKISDGEVYVQPPEADGSGTTESSVISCSYDGIFCGGAGGGLSPMPLISRIVSRITSPLIFKLSTLSLSTVSCTV